VVGRTPLGGRSLGAVSTSAPDPQVRLCQVAEIKGPPGCRPHSQATAPISLILRRTSDSGHQSVFDSSTDTSSPAEGRACECGAATRGCRGWTHPAACASPLTARFGPFAKSRTRARRCVVGAGLVRPARTQRKCNRAPLGRHRRSAVGADRAGARPPLQAQNHLLKALVLDRDIWCVCATTVRQSLIRRRAGHVRPARLAPMPARDSRLHRFARK